MTIYLLDTDHLSYLQQRHPSVLANLMRLPEQDRVFTTVVNIAELLRGVLLLPKGRRRDKLLDLYHQVLQHMEVVLPVTTEAVDHFAEIDAGLREKGLPIPVNDVWVAAVARSIGAVLVTNDEHYHRIRGLSCVNWVLEFAE